MLGWIKRLIDDGKGNPNEAIVLMLLADLILCILIIVLIMVGHYPTIAEAAGGFTAVHAIGHAGTWANNG